MKLAMNKAKGTIEYNKWAFQTTLETILHTTQEILGIKVINTKKITSKRMLT